MAALVVSVQIDSQMAGVPDTVKNTNYGTNDTSQARAFYASASKSSLIRGIVNFDVSALASVTIESAVLTQKVTTANGGGTRIARCTRPSTWTETGVTWNKYDGTNAWTDAGGDFDDVTPTPVDYTAPSSTGYFEVTGLSAFVTDAIANRGNLVSLILRLNNESPGATSGSAWDSQEGTTPWTLIVEYVDNTLDAVAPGNDEWPYRFHLLDRNRSDPRWMNRYYDFDADILTSVLPAAPAVGTPNQLMLMGVGI